MNVFEKSEASDPGKIIAVKMLITGKVNQVGYRKWIERRCTQAGLAGWVKNRRAPGVCDSVDLMLEGPTHLVHELIGPLAKGPPKSEVTSVSILYLPALGRKGFKSFESTDEEALPSNAFTEKLVAGYRQLTAALSEGLMNQFGNLFSRKEVSSAEATTVCDAILTEHLPENMGKRFKNLRASYGFSLTNEMWSQTKFRMSTKSLVGHANEMLLENKEYGLDFAKRLGLKVPTVIGRHIPLYELELAAGTVVKPVSGAGSKGVYVILDEEEIWDLSAARKLTSFGELRAAMRSALDRKVARVDSWVVEKIILNREGGIPNDLKMLTFYGEVVMVQETTRLPTRFCYYDRNGERITTGRYENRLFEGTGILSEYIDLAEEISLKIPAPFMRIDFLKSGDGPIYGEFTPRPGSFHRFNLETDRRLGRHYVEARARLFNDLYHGKKFPEFDAFVESNPAMVEGCQLNGRT